MTTTSRTIITTTVKMTTKKGRRTGDPPKYKTRHRSPSHLTFTSSLEDTELVSEEPTVRSRAPNKGPWNASGEECYQIHLNKGLGGGRRSKENKGLARDNKAVRRLDSEWNATDGMDGRWNCWWFLNTGLKRRKNKQREGRRKLRKGKQSSTNAQESLERQHMERAGR